MENIRDRRDDSPEVFETIWADDPDPVMLPARRQISTDSGERSQTLPARRQISTDSGERPLTFVSGATSLFVHRLSLDGEALVVIPNLPNNEDITPVPDTPTNNHSRYT